MHHKMLLRCMLVPCFAGSASVHFLRLDITDSASVKHFAAALENEFGGVTILINNAGMFTIRAVDIALHVHVCRPWLSRNRALSRSLGICLYPSPP